ncbi:hypothetical protein HPB51_007333 [Rhipicephalus microplus]|uniref:RING-type domain-containing protein n=1 Tax=Rhipicephalus microplus TaxID=6941 RepID=A0A9J6EZ09_RHIMP|nr:hypothetical protein HPB51_007333 [Rhipicephalus microplus]
MGPPKSTRNHGEREDEHSSSATNTSVRPRTASKRDTRRRGYVLKGFEIPILKTRRPISFVQHLSRSRVCVLCRAVPSKVIELSCNHVACFGCVSLAFRRDKDKRGRAVCPKHRVPLIGENVKVVDNTEHLFGKMVFCINSPFGCTHRCTLGDLDAHSSECDFYPLPCVFCDKDIPECEYQEHSRQCPQRNPFQDIGRWDGAGLSWSKRRVA